MFEAILVTAHQRAVFHSKRTNSNGYSTRNHNYDGLILTYDSKVGQVSRFIYQEANVSNWVDWMVWFSHAGANLLTILRKLSTGRNGCRSTREPTRWLVSL